MRRMLMRFSSARRRNSSACSTCIWRIRHASPPMNAACAPPSTRARRVIRRLPMAASGDGRFTAGDPGRRPRRARRGGARRPGATPEPPPDRPRPWRETGGAGRPRPGLGTMNTVSSAQRSSVIAKSTATISSHSPMRFRSRDVASRARRNSTPRTTIAAQRPSGRICTMSARSMTAATSSGGT